ncbi:hypothetical protein SRABI106_03392 [Rahnella aquatilis]|nr:hypothetical protein SRABI106_03392 [Rahnella aquatilis]
MGLNGFNDLCANAELRVQGGQRILENIGHPRAAALLQLALRSRQHLFAADVNRASGDFSRWGRYQPHHGQRSDAFSRSALSNQPQTFSFGNVKTYAFDRCDGLFSRAEIHL